MKILIVGGGVAGPALAGFLKDSAEITLVDKAPKWGNIGYAITLWGNGMKILRKLGVDHTLLKAGYEIPWTISEDKKGKVLEFFYLSIYKKYGALTTVARSDLQLTLTKNIENTNVKIKMGTTVSSINQHEKFATVTLSDGTTEDYDLVVGADGIHSEIREMVFGKNFLHHYGWKVFAFWTPREFVPPKGAIDMLGGGKICFIYPMEDKAVVMLSVASNTQTFEENENSKDVLHKNFADFKDIVDKMIDAIPAEEHIFKDNLAHVDMNKWFSGRVVLIGDAQHAISPLAGMGSSMALEDAYVLSEEIKKNMSDIPKALRRFEKRRTGRIQRFRHASAIIEDWMMVKSPFVSVFRDLILRILPSYYFTRLMMKVLREKI